MKKRLSLLIAVIALLVLIVVIVWLVVQVKPSGQMANMNPSFDSTASQQMQGSINNQNSPDVTQAEPDLEQPEPEPTEEPEAPPTPTAPDASTLFAEMGVVEDYRDVFVHGNKGAEHQKYIMLHDTEGWGSPSSVISYWSGNGNLVAAHFIVGTDGSVYQCVAMDKIAHHAGFGNAGNNAKYGVTDESRDDKKGTVSIGSAHPDYGMNSYSVGIEMVHVGGGGEYPTAQLEALDKLIAYIDAYYGFESAIVAHNEWRTSNSDMSAEFSTYLANYKNHRSYKSL